MKRMELMEKGKRAHGRLAAGARDVQLVAYVRLPASTFLLGRCAPTTSPRDLATSRYFLLRDTHAHFAVGFFFPCITHKMFDIFDGSCSSRDRLRAIQDFTPSGWFGKYWGQSGHMSVFRWGSRATNAVNVILSCSRLSNAACKRCTAHFMCLSGHAHGVACIRLL
jgi:hypothetical protein